MQWLPCARTEIKRRALGEYRGEQGADAVVRGWLIGGLEAAWGNGGGRFYGLFV